MKSVVDGIIKFRKTMNINAPIDKEISKEEFEDLLSLWPKAIAYNYANATILKSPWLGKMKWIAMYHLNTRRYYKLI